MRDIYVPQLVLECCLAIGANYRWLMRSKIDNKLAQHAQCIALYALVDILGWIAYDATKALHIRTMRVYYKRREQMRDIPSIETLAIGILNNHTPKVGHKPWIL